MTSPQVSKLAERDSNTVKARFDLIQGGEQWELRNGQWEATGTALVYRKLDGQLYYGWSSMTFRDYRKPGDIPTKNIAREALIPIEAYCPPLDSSCLQCSVVTDNVFVKTPSLLSYNWLDDSEDKGDICKSVLRELNVCEQLRKHPHPHIAEYLGCHVTDGRISGLCFKKYEQTLRELFNPNSYPKRATQTPGWSEEQIAQCLDPVESAVRHLHSLELVHNDVNPANVMFDQHQTPILIDFGSCCSIGLSLEEVGRTYEWHDEKVSKAQPSNDLDAIREMREWLNKNNPKSFLFPE